MGETEPTARVRAARPGDAERLGEIGRGAFALTYRGLIPDEVLAEWRESITDVWHRAFETRPPDDPWRAWVAERDTRVIGYATTSSGKDEWLPPPEGAGELTNLYLDPDAIGAGVGRLLYEHAVADLRARRFNPLVVWAFRDNPLARRFYDRMGLTVDVPDHDWVLGGVPCPIVRYRLAWPVEREPA
jgi:GNAT superfamily N-acetyltransferase